MYSITIIGCGNIGSMLVSKFIQNKNISEIYIVNKSNKNLPFKSKKITYFNDISEVKKNSEFIFLTIKPQDLCDLLDSLSKTLSINNFSKLMIISCVAGIKIHKIQKKLPDSENIQLIRVMPNIGLATGTSSNLFFGSISEIDKVIVEDIFKLTGKNIWLENEDFIDEMTPLSGSGPFYFLLLSKILSEIMVDVGIKEDDAYSIAKCNLISAAEMVKENSNLTLDEMIGIIMSKGGVTESILNNIEYDLELLLKRSYDIAMEKIKLINNLIK